MLVLSRRKDEAIVVGDEVVFTIIDIKGDQVKVGVVAPKSVSVHRKEVYDTIQKENVAAANVAPAKLLSSLASLARSFKKPDTKQE